MLIHFVIVLDSKVSQEILDLVAFSSHIPVPEDRLGGHCLLRLLNIKHFACCVVVREYAQVGCDFHRSLSDLFCNQSIIV